MDMQKSKTIFSPLNFLDGKKKAAKKDITTYLVFQCKFTNPEFSRSLLKPCSWGWGFLPCFHSRVLSHDKIKVLSESLLEVLSKLRWRARTGMVQWVECWPKNQEVTGLIPGQSTCQGCEPGPQLPARSPVGGLWDTADLIDVYLPHFLPPFPCLQK